MLFDNVIAFTAVEFHVAFVVPFFVDFTHRILIEGFDLALSVKHMLTAVAQSSVARHTNIIFMHRNPRTSSVTSTLYVFTHPSWRPWGEHLPPACPTCASPHSWANVVKKGSTYSFACRYGSCTASCSFDKPEGFELFTEPVNGGRWMKKDYKF
jgi:hypothetical protein